MDLVALGKIVRTHGIKGAMFLRSDSSDDSALRYLKKVWLTEFESLTISESAWMPKGWKLQVEEVTSIERAQTFIGKILFADRNDLSGTEDNEFYLHDLIGAEAIDALTGDPVAKFLNAEPAQSADHWWFECEKGTFSLPATKHFILRVEPHHKKIHLQNYHNLIPC